MDTFDTVMLIQLFWSLTSGFQETNNRVPDGDNRKTATAKSDYNVFFKFCFAKGGIKGHFSMVIFFFIMWGIVNSLHCILLFIII